MHQFFTDTPLEEGGTYIFTKEQAHHARDVARLDHETIRLVHEGRAFFAIPEQQDGQYIAKILKEDTSVHETPVHTILALALIRREKFELVLQKAAELGADEIIPFISERCVVQKKKEKEDRQKERWNTILKEASQQCKRNVIPAVSSIMDFKELKNINADLKLLAYEKRNERTPYVSELLEENIGSVILVIGPEGGFTEKEAEELISSGFDEVSLGSRILRAETAAMYGLSVIAETAERRQS